MKNIDFLKEVLMSDAEYWIVAKEVTVAEFGKSVRKNDHIMFITIPNGIKRGIKYEEITLQELDKLKNSYCEQNIYINTDYPPFQQNVSFYDIYKGFPVTHKIHQFMFDALSLASDEIYKYKELIQEIPVEVENEIIDSTLKIDYTNKNIKVYQKEYESYIKQVTDGFINMQSDITTQQDQLNMLIVEWNCGLDWKVVESEERFRDGNLMKDNRKYNSEIALKYLNSNTLTYDKWVAKYKVHYIFDHAFDCENNYIGEALKFI